MPVAVRLQTKTSTSKTPFSITDRDEYVVMAITVNGAE